MTSVLDRVARAPDRVIVGTETAGDATDLYLPRGERRGSVVLVHGGFWRAAYDRTHLRPLAAALADRGWVVLVPEYLRVGQAGGGWPGSARDLERVTRRAAGVCGVDLAAARLVGHSAGGHLALIVADALGVEHVVSLGGVLDLQAAHRDRLSNDAAGAFVGRSGDMAQADPMCRAVPRAGVHVLHGADDREVPAAYARAYAARDPRIRIRILPGTGHYELIDPRDAAFATLLEALDS
ncbi:alpha/beta hydrolase family protein [Microbacterium excoecariae]|uniref:alpha/beta hydrolase family protein n=1 Tax=Microbacterium excoecariae TaxID=2715210 RepID=UPI001407B260|nr:alpha/beta hydrolase [Microbacterium excoecariae]NHI16000.1 alpha/beta hydrolase [Microbacterium excoecariae]